MTDPRILLCATLGLLGLVLYRSMTTGRRNQHPPSPKSFPFIGNLFSVPPGLDHLAYMELGKQLNSDIIYLRILGKDIIVLNSVQAASDLLEKRSALYSDRSCAAMVRDPTLLDWSRFPAMVGYNELWRHYRRMMNNWLNARAVTQFDGVHETESRLLLKRLLSLLNNTQPFEPVKRQFFYTMGSSMFHLAYGYRLQGDHDPFFTNAVRTTEHLFDACMLSNFFVNVLPSLSGVPDWLPGTGWKRIAREWRLCKEEAMDKPYNWTKAQVAAGGFEPSILSALFQDHSLVSGFDPEERDKRLKELALVLYIGGADTSATSLVNFVAAMVLNPRAQAKAQEEIDAVLGHATRLPNMSDRDRLPYVRNLILEVLRWYPVTPTGGSPHVCFKDDTYKGYHISKGTTIIGNLWAMSRDESVYKDPDVFNPDRFMDPSVPPLPGFGWGRRKCPGVHFAEASLFIKIASLLATFTFSKKLDVKGEEITPEIEGAANALVLQLKPFEFELKPRSEKHYQLILEGAGHRS